MNRPEPSAPMSPLSMAVHSLPEPTLGVDQRTRQGRLKMLLVMLLCAAPVIASYFTYYVIRPSGAATNYGTLIVPVRPLPDAKRLPLTDLQGAAVNPQSLRGQWLLVVVGDGACDAQCEQLLYAQRQLRESLGREKDRMDRVWFITGNAPVRPALLPAMAQATLLRVPAEALAGWLAPDAGEPLSAHLYLVDPMGNWMMRFPPRFEPAKVRKDIDRLLRAAASWDKEGR